VTDSAPTSPGPVPDADEGDAPPARLSRRAPWGLRRRILFSFTFGSTFLALLLAVTTYGLARSNVVQQREAASIDTSRRNAQTVQASLRGPATDFQPAVDALEAFGVQRAVVWYGGQWSPGSGRYRETALPQPLVDRVVEDTVPARMIVEVEGDPSIVVGWPLANDAAYFEFFSLDEVAATLGSVRLSLYLACLITIVLGIIVGTFAARRAVRPVADAALAAKAIAGGHLGTRLEPSEDPDLGVLARSFNDMAEALQRRIERDARFASDVSHELRSPLMTLAASIEVIEGRRHEMPERAQAAVDLLRSDVSRFRTLVEDLLEISRFDAGAVRMHFEELLTTQFVQQAIAVSSMPDTSLTSSVSADRTIITGDRRRLARAVANLIDNARVHGGGRARVTISTHAAADESTDAGPGGTRVRIIVDDEGPGVPEDERSLIFERFARGGGAGRRSGNDGAGLGLALVAEHVRMHGGEVWVEDRGPDRNGARFVIELPAEEVEAE
jgi:two-component system sensor histidine kinase MtrB